MEIDLTKKPEDATHISPHNGMWIKYLGGGGGHYQFFKNGQWEMGFGCMSNSYLEIAKPDPWTGEGLPPVGTVCEYQCGYVEQPYKHAACTIIAHFIGESGKTLAAFTYVAHDGVVQLGRGIAELFRPVRTAKQIAAEERASAIEEMTAANEHALLKDWAAYLYDTLGYRKQAQP